MRVYSTFQENVSLLSIELSWQAEHIFLKGTPTVLTLLKRMRTPIIFVSFHETTLSALDLCRMGCIF